MSLNVMLNIQRQNESKTCNLMISTTSASPRGLTYYDVRGNLPGAA
jgi:hypothetical protein